MVLGPKPCMFLATGPSQRYLRMYIYIRTYIHTYIHTYVHIHIYTRTHKMCVYSYVGQEDPDLATVVEERHLWTIVRIPIVRGPLRQRLPSVYPCATQRLRVPNVPGFWLQEAYPLWSLEPGTSKIGYLDPLGRRRTRNSYKVGGALSLGAQGTGTGAQGLYEHRLPTQHDFWSPLVWGPSTRT